MSTGGLFLRSPGADSIEFQRTSGGQDEG